MVNKMVEIIICGIYKITSPTGRVYIGQSKILKTGGLVIIEKTVQKGKKC